MPDYRPSYLDIIMPYERRHEPLLPPRQWLRRVVGSVWLAASIVVAALGIGIVGYHEIGGLPWIDALLESSMILGGMGAIAPMRDDATKLFASFYALFSGLAVITTTGVILAPWLHRMLHWFHAHHPESGRLRTDDD